MGAQFCCCPSGGLPYAAIITAGLIFTGGVSGGTFVARPKVPLTLLLGYGLTISFGQFAFLSLRDKFGMPAGLASLVLRLC